MTHTNTEPMVALDDPIVAEVRKQRDAIAAAVNYDLHTLVAQLQELEEAEGKAGRRILPAPGQSGAAA
jgi:hypothetical protein